MKRAPFSKSSQTIFGLETDPSASLRCFANGSTELHFRGKSTLVEFDGKRITCAPKMGERALAGLNAVIRAILAGQWHNHTVEPFDVSSPNG